MKEDRQRQILVMQCISDIECCVLLEAERYEIYPTYHYTLSSERKQGQWEMSSNTRHVRFAQEWIYQVARTGGMP
jgi:hypothetical protein